MNKFATNIPPLGVRGRILFTVGSPNQTSQMHQIAAALPEYDCWFSQFYGSSFAIRWVTDSGLVNNTIAAGQFKAKADKYLAENNLQVDYRAEKNTYDLVVLCSDIIVPKNVQNTKKIWVQEGMIDPNSWATAIIQKLKLPRFFTLNTSLNGSSNQADIFCCASEGYKGFFTKKGTDAQKLLVTGMPNFDNAKQFLENDFPYKNYVLVATTDMRETFRRDNRVEFIKNCVKIANGRSIIFKLHPNELYDRAAQEIKENTPKNTLIFQAGNTNEMIANCDALITQYSTVVYVGMGLGKEVYSYFDMEELKRLSPLQNDGTSAQNIANICRNFIEFEGKKEDFLKSYHYEPIYAKGQTYATSPHQTV
jgi:hypothetical protein